MQRDLHRTRRFIFPCRFVLKLNVFCYRILPNPVKVKLGFKWIEFLVVNQNVA